MLAPTPPSCEQLSNPMTYASPIPTIITPADKRMSPPKQRHLSLHTFAFIPSADFQIFTDGSTRGRIEDGSAGLVVHRQDDHEWHAHTSTHSSYFQAEKATVREAIQWLSSISSWASAIIICNCNSLVQAVSNANLSVIQLQAAAAVLAISKSFLTEWAPGHCGQSGNGLADHRAKLGATETQPDNALEPATQRAHVRRSSRPLPSNTSGCRCAGLCLMSR